MTTWDELRRQAEQDQDRRLSLTPEARAMSLDELLAMEARGESLSGAATPLSEENHVTAVYTHPQGGVITVFADDTFIAIGANGKPKKTSATPAKLAAGYGLWRRTGPS